MSTTALTTDGRFPVRRKRPNRPSVDNAFPSSWCPHYGVRFKSRTNPDEGAKWDIHECFHKFLKINHSS